MYLGVACAVVNDEGHLLLARRSDLNIWNLPGGRLDSGEFLDDAAAREVQEETGVIARIDRAAGLYFSPLTGSTLVTFVGWPLGGTPRHDRLETTAVQYFPQTHLPQDLFRPVMALDALAGTRHLPRVLEMSPAEMRRLKRRLALRWVENLVRGRPEPKRVKFDVQAVAVVWDETYRRILTLKRKRTESLPRVICTGERPPWEALTDVVRRETSVEAGLRWVGAWQDVNHDKVEFIFAATAHETHDLPENAEWTLALNGALPSRETRYVQLVTPSYPRDAVWLLGRDKGVEAGDTISLTGSE